MKKKKSNRGGSRSGAGRKSKYGEPTDTIAIRLPVSKIAEVKKWIKEKLKEWAKVKAVFF